jgi:Ca2+-binding RTX toxin-like protein
VGNFRQEFTGFDRIVIDDAGQGDDYLDFRGVSPPSRSTACRQRHHLPDGSGSVVHAAPATTPSLPAPRVGRPSVIHGDAATTSSPPARSPSKTTAARQRHHHRQPESDNPATFGGLYGDEDTDTINAGDGDDYADGGSGSDTTDGGAGNDQLPGAAGMTPPRSARR